MVESLASTSRKYFLTLLEMSKNITKTARSAFGDLEVEKKTPEDLGAAVSGKGPLKKFLGSCMLQAHKL